MNKLLKETSNLVRIPDANFPEEVEEYLRCNYGLFIQGHTSIITTVVVSTDSKFIISGSNDHTVRIWNFQSRQQEAILLGHSAPVTSLCITTDSKFIISASADRTLIKWSMLSRTLESVLEGHFATINSVSVSKDCKYIVSASNDATIRIWDFANNSQLAVLEGHTSPVTCAAIINKNKSIISTSLDATIRGWDLLEHTSNFTIDIDIKYNAIINFVISSDELIMITIAKSKAIDLWNLRGAGLIKEFPFQRITTWISNSLAISMNNQYAIYGAVDGGLYWSEISTGTQQFSVKKHSSWINSIAITSDDRFVVTGSSDKTIKVFSLHEKTLEAIMEGGHTGAIKFTSFTRDGRFLISCCKDRVIKLWNLEEKKEETTTEAYKSHISSMVVTNDENCLVLGLWDCTVRVLDLKKKLKETVFEGHKDWVTSVVCTADSKFAVSASMDMNIRVWKLSSLEGLHRMN